MGKQIEQGFFTSQLANTLATMTLASGQALCLQVIAKFEQDHPKVRTANLVKARKMVNAARTSIALAEGVYDFVLAHPSEGLGVIK